jgi:hypothetical protein
MTGMEWESGGFWFGLAGPADEPEIRQLVGATAMPGALSIRFEREPDYFLGCDTMGRSCDVLIARERGSGALAGMLCRTEDEVFVNREPTRVGGISQLRIAERFRGLRLLELGWPVFRERGIRYLTVVARGNPRAVRALLEGSPGSAHVHRVGGMTTLGLPVRRWGLHPRLPAGVVVRAADDRSIDEIVAFLNTAGRRLQFAPVRRREDFTRGRRLRGLDPGAVFVARSPSGILGTLGLWDQRGYKQDIVDSYGPSLARLRPALNVALQAVGAAALPAPGRRIEGAFAALPMVADDDPRVFACLLDAVLGEAQRRRLEWVTLGLSDDDPLLAVARQRLHVTYRSDVYSVTWDSSLPAAVAGRPYLEAAAM